MATSWSDTFVPFGQTATAEPGFRAVETAGSVATAFRGLLDDGGKESAPPPTPEQVRAETEARVRRELELELQNRLATEDGHLQEIVGTLMATRQQTLDACARQAAHLAIEAARRIVRREVSVDPSVLEGPLREGLARFAEAGEVVVRLHPEDARRLQANPALLEEFRIRRVEEDAGLARGDCLLQAGDRGLDLRVDSQLEEIASAIDAVLGEE